MRYLLVSLLLFLLSTCQDPLVSRLPPPVAVRSDSLKKPSPISADSLKHEMTGEIDMFIKGGFYFGEDLRDRVCDMFINEKVDTPWVEATINKAFRRRLVSRCPGPPKRISIVSVRHS